MEGASILGVHRRLGDGLNPPGNHFGALYHRYRLLDKELRPSIFYDLYLIVGSLAIALVIVYTVIRLLD